MNGGNRVFYIISFLIFTFFGIVFLRSSYQSKKLRENGTSAKAVVSETPDCGRSSNTMEVKLKENIYSINIGKNDCINGRYRIGDSVEVLYSITYNKAVLPTERTNLLYWMSLLFFIVPIYCLYQVLRQSKV